MGSGLLIERDHEIAVLEQRLAAATRGLGGTVVIEAPAGRGKSRLVNAVGDSAQDAGLKILPAYGNELEREFPFGLVIQLFGRRHAPADPAVWDALPPGQAGLVRSLLDTGHPEPAQSSTAHDQSLMHALFSLTRHVAFLRSDHDEPNPLLILIDDIHWADHSSMRFVGYLAERISELPCLLVVTARTGEISSEPLPPALLDDASGVTYLRPGSLSDAGVEMLVRGLFPDAEPYFIAACARVTGGDPFLLAELLADLRDKGLRPDRVTASRLDGLAPERIVDSVSARLGAMPDAAVKLATALSVLGEGASLRQSARLAELDEGQAADAATSLVAVGMLHPGERLSFVHPLIRSTVAASISPLARSDAHRRAAIVLASEGAPPERIASHLLIAPAEADKNAVETLRAAARTALERGAATSAIPFLERALAELLAPDVRSELLSELAGAEAAAEIPNAAERLEEALTLTEPSERRAELALVQGWNLYRQGHYRQAARILDAALAGLGAETTSLASELEAAYVCAAALTPEMREEAAARRWRVTDRLAQPNMPAERVALAHIAAQESALGADPVTVRMLAEAAWDGGKLLEVEAPGSVGLQLACAALFFIDELERALEICDTALERACASALPDLPFAVGACRSWLLYHQGSISDAFAAAKGALAGRPPGQQTYLLAARGVLAGCLLYRGALGDAEAALRRLEDPHVPESVGGSLVLQRRAELRLAQHRPHEALADATRAGERLQLALPGASPGVIPWRSTAALAHLALGQATEAERLAAEELENAQRIGLTRVVVRNLRILGLTAGGATGIRLLEEAVAAGAEHPARLEYMLALVELGAALRRARQRSRARVPLREALALSRRVGASAITARAEIELAAAGSHARRAWLSGVESLTVSERRVADLAAQGLTTRRIAEALFVTPKTIEYHLRHVYQKLSVSSRGELAQMLAASPQGELRADQLARSKI